MSDDIQQHTIQKTNLAAVDANYLRLRLDTQTLHKDVLNFLTGYRSVYEYDDATGNTYERPEKIGEALANKEGVQALFSFIVTVVNSHTIQGNFDKNELDHILFYIEMGLTDRLILNWAKWGIDPDLLNHIIDTLMPMIQIILSRTKDNKEREGLTLGVERTSNYFENKDKKRGLF